MAWLDINLNELATEETKFDSAGSSIEPGVYNIVLENIYVDKTNSGTVFFALNGNIENSNKKLSLTTFSVERMLKNSVGNTKMSNGRYYTGIILLDKISKVIGKNINQLTPSKAFVEVFGTTKEVGMFRELTGVSFAIGIRKRITENNDKKYTNFEIINICNKNDNECIEKLKERIEKNPIIDETTKQKNIKDNDEDIIPF